MPLKRDPEWQKELGAIKDQSMRTNKVFWWASLFAVAAVEVLAVSVAMNAPSQVLGMGVIISASTLCLVAVINSGVKAVHGALVIVTGTIEWVGRKQLGEYETPDG